MSQELVINRRKQNFRAKKRIIKKAHRGQPKPSPKAEKKHEIIFAQPVTEKKLRREEKKKQIKALKKQAKQDKKMAMDAEE